jgi:hypothetical protein
MLCIKELALGVIVRPVTACCGCLLPPASFPLSQVSYQATI